MVKFTGCRRILNAAVAVVFYLGALFLVDRYVIGLPVLPQERAYAALVEAFPELKDKKMWSTNLSDRTWACNFGTQDYPAWVYGRFEHSGLGWKAVATGWQRVCYLPVP